MKEKFLSTEHYIAFKQLEDDYKNFIIHYDDFNNSERGTADYERQKYICINYLESAIEQKRILDIDFKSDTDKLFKLKFL